MLSVTRTGFALVSAILLGTSSPNPLTQAQQELQDGGSTHIVYLLPMVLPE
jgi:hypothetical protein